MKYTDETKKFVLVDNSSIPRDSRSWFDLKIDKAEEAGTIESFKSAIELILEEIAQVESEAAALRTDRLLREARLGIDVTLPDGSTMPAADRIRQIDEETQAAIAKIRKRLE
jgi:hypothetical protein